MKRFLALLLFAAMNVCAMAQAPANAEKHPIKVITRSSSVNTALLQDVWNAWCTLDPKNPAKFYDKTPGNVYFDIAPLEYHSWAEYETGVKAVLAGMKSGTAKVDEVKIHPVGPTTWATAIVHMDIQMKDGTSSKEDWRWTSVWEKRGGDWKIVHEHISAPSK